MSLQDDVLTVIRRVDENWAEGMLADKIGIFPISYVEVSQCVEASVVLVSCLAEQSCVQGEYSGVLTIISQYTHSLPHCCTLK